MCGILYVRSYNFNGCYIMSRDSAIYDSLGLHAYGDTFFSRDRVLEETVSRLVRESEAGLTQRELQDLLKVRVLVLLLNGVRNKTIYRETVKGFYLYFHNDPAIRDAQFKVRCSQLATTAYVKPEDSPPINSHVVRSIW